MVDLDLDGLPLRATLDEGFDLDEADFGLMGLSSESSLDSTSSMGSSGRLDFLLGRGLASFEDPAI